MFKQIIQTVRAQEVLDNLVESEEQLQDVNNELVNLTDQYLANNEVSTSFFNINNIYFWIVIGGLIFLAFGLILLIVELKKGSSVKEVEEDEPDFGSVEIQHEEDEIEEEEPKKTKVKRIKVKKVK